MNRIISSARRSGVCSHKRTRGIARAVLALSAVAGLFLFSCGDDDDDSTYAVTVSSVGTGARGGGNYAAGTVVTISAGTPPAYHAFGNWTSTSPGVAFTNANSATTTFTMPANAVTVTANFEWIITEGTIVDTRDNQVYRTVLMPDLKWWMAENLNYRNPAWSHNDATGEVSGGGRGSWCYNNVASNCNTHGRLYTWDAAMVACPAGWHLPSSSEWTTLENRVGNPAGTRLKSQSGWGNSNGTDDFGFTALPGGSRGRTGFTPTFPDFGNSAYWWTANESSTTQASGRMITGSAMGSSTASKANGYSVRCVRD